MSRFFYHMGRLLQFLKPGNAVTSAEIERMRQKNKELVKKLRELDAQHEKQDEANRLRESFVKESLEYVNKANAAHKEQMDRDLERAKAGLDLIENQAQLANDARMIRIKKAVKSGNFDEIDKLTDEVSREKAQAWVESLQSQSPDSASATKSARMDELRSNLAALTIDFSSSSPPSSQLRSRPSPAQHQAQAPPDPAAPSHAKQQPSTASPSPAPSPKSKSTSPQPFRREKQKI